MTKSFDEIMMHRAIQLAEEARVIAPPNPWVGCVLTKNGHTIGEGFTQPPGSSHAEVMALKAAGKQAVGATAYTTLEPCSHYGRTPPCANTLIEAGVSRVVIGIEDPDPNVRGRGIALLRSAGIEVVEGIHADTIKRQLAPYLYQRTTKLPYCIGKSALSIDGRTAAKDGSSQWISSEAARKDAHQLRAESQAIVIGAGTAIADLPRLTVRNVKQQPLRPPLRVVVDAAGKVPATGPLFNAADAPTLIATSPLCSETVKKQWKSAGAEVATLPNDPSGHGVDLRHLLELLGKRDILQVLVEGGASLLGSFIEERLLRHLRVYIGPLLLGSEGYPLAAIKGISTLNDAKRLHFIDSATFGDTLRVDYGICDMT